MSNSSFQWIKRNLGEFSQFATVQEMYLLNPKFDAVSTVDPQAHAHVRTDILLLSFLFSDTTINLSPFKSCLSQLEAFNALTLNQIAEIIVEDLPGLTDKEQLINIVFSNILTSQTLLLPQLVLLISEMNMVQTFLYSSL